MAGLIGNSIGDAIARAGAAIGQSYTNVAELGYRRLADEEKEARAMQRAEALERLKEAMIEERAQKDAAKAVDVEARATKIGEERAARQLDADAAKLAANAQQVAGSSPAMTQDEMKAHLESLNPSERKAIESTGLVGRAATRNEQRYQLAEDREQAARELGASSTLLKSYQDSKKAVLDAIKEENRERKEDNRAAEERAREDRRDREGRERADYQDRMARAAETRAGAAVTAANRPPAGGTDPNKPATTADLQRQITAAQNSLATELGVSKNDVNAEVAAIKKKAASGNERARATLERIQPFLDEYSSANQRMLEFKRQPSAAGQPTSPSRSGDNGNVKRDYRNLWN